MGKKKGKQRGEFISKSKRSSHFHEVYNRTTDDVHIPYYKHNNSTSSVSGNTNFRGGILLNGTTTRNRNNDCKFSSSLSSGRLSGPPVVNLRQIQNLLQERVHHDGIIRRTRQQRQQQLLYGQIPLPSQAKNKNTNGQSNAKNDMGWMLGYNHREFLAGCIMEADDDDDENSDAIPSLQRLCLKSIVSILPTYISTFGVDYVHDVLGTLPSSILEELSVNFSRSYASNDHDNDDASGKRMTDELAYTLANHSHLEGLVLTGNSKTKTGTSKRKNGAVGKNSYKTKDENHHHQQQQEQQNENDEMNCNAEGYDSLSSSTLTDSIFQCLMPRLISNTSTTNTISDEEEFKIPPSSSSSIASAEPSVESWEELDTLHDEELFTGCWNLQRLELHHYHPVTTIDKNPIQNLITFLEQCGSRITHLSISGSFNLITGSQFLFHDLRESFVTENDDDHDDDDEEFRTGNKASATNTSGQTLTPVSGTIMDLLTNLQILDLSHCKWVNYEILLSFLVRIQKKEKEQREILQRRNVSTKNMPCSSLKMISLVGCCPSLIEKLSTLKKALLSNGCSVPLLSITLQKKKRLF